MKKSKLLALFLALAMVLSLAACGSKDNGSANSPAPGNTAGQEESKAPENEGKTYNLRMSCEASEGQWLAIMLQDYADAVKEATNGQVNIELYLGNSLGSSDDIWSMFTQGAIDMVHHGAWPTPATSPSPTSFRRPSPCPLPRWPLPSWPLWLTPAIWASSLTTCTLWLTCPL